MKTIKMLGAALALALSGLLGACAVDTTPDRPEETVTQSDDELGNRIFCGGFAGFACPDGYTCVEKCKPGTADCGGYCRKSKPTPSHCKGDPSRSYISTDPNECALIKFFCAEGEPFSDDCGCGCQTSGTGGTPCNKVSCGAGEYCCNYSCSLCAPEGGACIQLWCSEEPVEL
jgi:hypothetical protein